MQRLSRLASLARRLRLQACRGFAPGCCALAEGNRNAGIHWRKRPFARRLASPPRRLAFGLVGALPAEAPGHDQDRHPPLALGHSWRSARPRSCSCSWTSRTRRMACPGGSSKGSWSTLRRTDRCSPRRCASLSAKTGVPWCSAVGPRSRARGSVAPIPACT